MINLQRTYSDQFLNQVAHEWCDDVKHFLIAERDKGFRVHANGHYEYPKTRTEKALKVIHNSDIYNALSGDDRRLIDNGILNRFVTNPDEFVLADQDKITELRDLMDGTWACAVPVLKDVFSDWYTEFTASEIGYKYMKKLNIRTCPYCNRNYTFTVESQSGEFKTRPEFDHFYDKNKYPLLALSFYNLVPSCHTCNHAKSTKRAGINPFFDGFHSRFAITKNEDGRKMNVSEALCVSNTNDFSIGMPDASESEEKNIRTFGINKLYNEHKDYVMEIIDKANAYNAIGAQNLIDAFQGLDHSPKDVFDFVWGRNLEEPEFLNRPLSKLTHDILQQLGINKQ